jgi:hypothetical protein
MTARVGPIPKTSGIGLVLPSWLAFLLPRKKPNINPIVGPISIRAITLRTFIAVSDKSHRRLSTVQDTRHNCCNRADSTSVRFSFAQGIGALEPFADQHPQ